jgi:hypothetical protein
VIIREARTGLGQDKIGEGRPEIGMNRKEQVRDRREQVQNTTRKEGTGLGRVDIGKERSGIKREDCRRV